MSLIPIETLTKMIAFGYGSVPRIRIPDDWETVPGPALLANRKICSRCKQPKEREEYRLCSAAKDGRQAYCIACANQAWRERRIPKKKPALKHGGMTGYNRGCRCAECKTGMLTYYRNKRATNKARLRAMS